MSRARQIPARIFGQPRNLFSFISVDISQLLTDTSAPGMDGWSESLVGDWRGLILT